MKLDYHLHADYSADSCITLPALAARAIERGYTEIALTEHFDLLPRELAHWGLPPVSKVARLVEKVRADFPQLSLIFGAELGEYHRTHKLADEVMAYDQPELKIGSVHILPSGINLSVKMARELTHREVEEYYRENLALAQFGRFNILGHLGVHRRYLANPPSEMAYRSIIEDIFACLIDQKIALEVNFSSFRKVYRSLIPEPEWLQLYLSMGGRLITLGSDAHQLEHFDDHHHTAVAQLQALGFAAQARWNGAGFDLIPW